MRYILTNYSKAYYNMALEELLMEDDSFDEEYLFFYIHTPSVIVGRNQNTFSEINPSFIKEHNITVARRISGGGAVYHDEGNLNFSFVCKKEDTCGIDFKKYTYPVINALASLGIKADLSERNDILIDGKKFSGNAEYIHKGKILHHGTLMFDVNVENLVKALSVHPLKLQSKAIKSVQSRVANLKDYLHREMSIEEFRDYLIDSFKKEMDITPLTLSQQTLQRIEEKVQTKFSTKEYNFNQSPKVSFIKEKKFPSGLIQAYLSIEQGNIKDISLFGDFFFTKDIRELEDALRNTPYDIHNVQQVISALPIDEYIKDSNKNELLSLLFS